MQFGKPKIRQTPAGFLKARCASKEMWDDSEGDPEVLTRLIQLLRPSRPDRVTIVDLSDLLAFLKTNTKCCERLSAYLKLILYQRKFNKFLSDAAILQDADFIYEVRKRIAAKLLPRQPQKDQLEYILTQVFYLATDQIWIKKIPLQQLTELFDLLKFNDIYESITPNSPLSEVLLAMNLIIQRISGRAMETEVIKMVPEFDDLESPFTAFERELLQIEEKLRSGPRHYITGSDLSYRQLQIFHKQCSEFVDKAFSNSSKYGISLRVNQNLLKIRQQLARLQVLMPLLIIDNEPEKKYNSISLTLMLITYNCHKNNVRKFISESTQLISYEITQHTAKTGEHYITESSNEYFRMLRSALGGGLIVGILCIIKVLLSKVDTSIFGHAFLYSMNYAAGFIAIYLCGFTLATKQPAMTASALAKALEDGIRKKGPADDKYAAFAILFARVFRSQFIAFVGNVAMAFPVSLLGIWLIDHYLKYNIASQKWLVLLTDLSPVHSAAIFHAAIAGAFLFLSGIISGSIANRDKHNQIYYRIQEHPLLKKTFGRKRTFKLAKVYEKRWAGIISNFWFGVFMGCTAPLGLVLGLNLDVRHITFTSGNLALGLYGSGFMAPHSLLYWAIAGIGVVGLVNFVVSFTLSVTLALRSRNISLFELRFVALAIGKHFSRKPVSFFFPTEKKGTSEFVEQKY